MSDYQADYAAILAKASELYRMLDALAEKRNAEHRERDAIALANAKLQIQKLLGVPPIIAAQPIVTPVSVTDDNGAAITEYSDGVFSAKYTIDADKKAIDGLPVVETDEYLVDTSKGDMKLGKLSDFNKPASRRGRK